MRRLDLYKISLFKMDAGLIVDPSDNLINLAILLSASNRLKEFRDMLHTQTFFFKSDFLGGRLIYSDVGRPLILPGRVSTLVH